MAAIVVVCKILFLVLIAHSFVAQLGPKRPAWPALVECGQVLVTAWQPSENCSSASEQNEKWLQPRARPVRSDDDGEETGNPARQDNSAVEIRWPAAAAESVIGQQRPGESTLAKSSASGQLKADVADSRSRAPNSAAAEAGEEEAAVVISATRAEFGVSGSTEAAASPAVLAAEAATERPEHQQRQLLDKRVGELWRSMMNPHGSEGNRQADNTSILAHESNGRSQPRQAAAVAFESVNTLDTTREPAEDNGGEHSMEPARGTQGAAATSRPGSRASGSSSQSAPVNYAELCYLADGGSSLTLTVNEATPVGSIIGTVEVNGDPSLETGNVDLFDAPELAQSQAGLSSSAAASARQAAALDRAGTSSDPTASGSIAASDGLAVPRVLGRRSVAGDSTLESTATTSSAEKTLAAPRVARGQPPPLSASQMLARTTSLGGDSHSHSPSFYSLLQAPTSTSGHQQRERGEPQQQQAVRLEPGTQNLILVRQLDKESGEGEQSLVINIRCSPRNSNGQKQAPTAANLLVAATSPSHKSREPAPDTVIPVRIIVTDANDHAPEFLGQQPYIVNISETAPIGSVAARDILAIDRDSAGPFSTIHYKVLDDGAGDIGSGQQASSLLQFANPLEPTLVVVGQLDYETLGSSFTLTIVAQDQAEPEPLSTSAQVQVNVIDFDDQNPRFLDDKYTLVMDESQQSLVGQNLQVLPRNLYAEDGDRGIRAPIMYSFDQLGNFQQAEQPSTLDETTTSSSTSLSSLIEEPSLLNIEHYLHLNPTSGEIRLIRQWPSGWAGSPMTLVVRATQADNKDRYTLTTLTITRPSLATPTSAHQQGNHHQRGPTIGQRSSPTSSGLGAAESSAAGAVSTTAVQTTSGKQRAGIEFVPDRLVVNVPENATINEKIARVRARHSSGTTTRASLESAGSSSVQDADHQLGSVDLVADLSFGPAQPTTRPTSGAAGSSNKSRRTRAGESSGHQQAASRRPINYQLLDDPTDQFGINGLGEVFLRRALDYEQRQEFKFRVLATYTKYSDICQLQVNVLNVNDNKPKFTQPQYTFHLTESRLKSNLIGPIQAHDADINDTLQYSLAGDQAHLFEINSSGLLSLRPSTRQLNVSSCQLIVQATDSLAPPFHSQQARVNLHVAPQLLGRSLNFETTTEGAQIGSRSLVEGQQQWGPFGGSQSSRAAPTASAGQQQSGGAREPVASQRSSVATVMASLQHMVRSVNFLDMPMSSALLLSALLAFLVCLLLIVVISMGVHFYLRRAKARQTRRRHLAAAAHLRQAHLAALHCGSPDSAAASSVAAVARADRARYLHKNRHPHNPSTSRRQQQQSSPQTGSSSPAGSSARTSSNWSPTNSTVADANSPNQYSPASGRQQQASSASQQRQSLSTPNVPIVRTRLTAKVAPATTPINNNGFSATSGGSRNLGSKPSSSLATTAATTASQQTSQLQHHPALSQPLSIRSPLDTLSARLQSVVSGSPDLRLATGKPGSVGGGRLQTGASSLISSLSSHSKGSYRSNSTDDSSVMHCGHYSVNPAALEAPATTHQSQLEQQQRSPGQRGRGDSEDLRARSRQDSIEAAIKNLVRQDEQQEGQQGDAAGSEGQPELVLQDSDRAAQSGRRLRSSPAGLRPKGHGRGGALSPGRPKSSSSCRADEDSSVSTAGRPGIKSYRKLPMMGSLVRPLNKTAALASSGDNDFSPADQQQVVVQLNIGQQQQQADSAIASDASSGASSNLQETGLMAMIRDPDKRLSSGSALTSEQLLLERQQAIRWPQGAIPNRVKKLTWDDELSNSGVTFGSAEMGVDCYPEPELAARIGPSLMMSPQSSNGRNNHHYDDGDRESREQRYRDQNDQNQLTANNSQQYSSGQHFLLDPCSPALNSEFICPFVAPPTQVGLMMLSSEGAKRLAASKSGQQQLLFDEQLSSLGQNNCFDYTIVQQSQFQVDSFVATAAANDHQQQQQHLLQRQHTNQGPTTTSYLYNSNGGGGGHQPQVQAALSQQL